MPATPMDIRLRPYSVEPFTKVMLPDGIFDTALFSQEITCHYTNESAATLHNVTIYLEGVGDPGIVPVPHTHTFGEIPAGASVRVAWLADFRNATPGKKIVSVIAEANGHDLKRALKKIFVSSTVRDTTTGDFHCTIPEGTFIVSRLEVIGPRNKWRPCSDRDEKCVPSSGPWVPARLTITFVPNPGYAGIHGDLPFSDPWWKILAWIIFAIATIVAIVAAAHGEGTAGTAVSGEFDETTGDVDCCEPDPGGIPGDSTTVAGVASIIATTALAVGLSDDADPWWRGQEATPPANGLLTVSESVDVKFAYPAGAPQAGEAYPVDVDWTYVRHLSNGSTLTHTVQETQKNIHLSGGVEIEAPAEIFAFQEPLVIKARIKREDGTLFSGEGLHVFCMLRSPDDLYFHLPLLDDGVAPDEKANDGTYTGEISLEEIYPILLKRKAKLEGLWRIYLFAQDINSATPDMAPEVAATNIGGFMVASAIQITFDPTLPCPLQAHAAVTVIV